MEDIKKVLVVGRSGQLASAIVKYLMDESPDSIEWDAVSRTTLDITDKDSIARVFLGKRYDYVINCAAYTDVAGSEFHSYDAAKVNTLGPLNLAEQCRLRGARLIHISTDYVFDGIDDAPYDESYPTNPINEYGESKCRGEQKLESMDGLEYMIIRISTLYGDDGKNIVRTFYNMMKDGKEIHAVDNNLFNTTYAGDLAGFIINDIIIKDGFNPGILHFANPGEFSSYDLAVCIRDYMGVKDAKITPVRNDEYVSSVNRPQYSSFDMDKLYTIYGYHTVPTGRASLKKFVKMLMSV